LHLVHPAYTRFPDLRSAEYSYGCTFVRSLWLFPPPRFFQSSPSASSTHFWKHGLILLRGDFAVSPLFLIVWDCSSFVQDIPCRLLPRTSSSSCGRADSTVTVSPPPAHSTPQLTPLCSTFFGSKSLQTLWCKSPATRWSPFQLLSYLCPLSLLLPSNDNSSLLSL